MSNNNIEVRFGLIRLCYRIIVGSHSQLVALTSTVEIRQEIR